MLVDVMTEEVQLLHTEDALVGVDHNPVMREALEYRAYIPEVLFRSSTGNQDVIDVRVGCGDTTEDLVHEPLECLCCIPESEGHAHKLEQTKGCGDCSLRYIRGVHWDLVVGSYKVQFCEDSGALQGGGEIVDVGNRVAVRHSTSVECTVVSTGTPVTRSLLRHHMQG